MFAPGGGHSRACSYVQEDDLVNGNIHPTST